MAHEITDIDNVLLKGEAAWHGLGLVINEELGAVEAGKRLGLLWPTEQWSLTAHGPNGQTLDISDRVANIRVDRVSEQDIRHCLGIVGKDYTVCQNQELAEFTDALAQTGKVVIETCGSIRGGKVVWFLARGACFDLGGGDTMYPYMCVSNGHDGQNAISVDPTTVRAVCANTLGQIIQLNGQEKKIDTSAITIRHMGALSNKLEEARKALKYYEHTLARNRELYQMMQEKKIGKDVAIKLFADLYPTFWDAATPDMLNNKDHKVRNKAEALMGKMEEASRAFLERYNNERAKFGCGDNLWLAMNAMTGYLQHDRAVAGKTDVARWEAKLERNMFGQGAAQTRSVLAYALAIAG